MSWFLNNNSQKNDRPKKEETLEFDSTEKKNDEKKMEKKTHRNSQRQ